MKRIGIVGAAMAAGLGAALSGGAGTDVVTIERERPVTAKRRHVAPSNRTKRVSKYMPHIGAKEQERAKRCYMQTHFPVQFAAGESGFKNQAALSAPVLCQMSKANHEAYLEAREQEYESMF